MAKTKRKTTTKAKKKKTGGRIAGNLPPIEQLEAAGALDPSRLRPEVRAEINRSLTQQQVRALIEVKRMLPGSGDPFRPDPDGSIF
jgi:hypothetical protein